MFAALLWPAVSGNAGVMRRHREAVPVMLPLWLERDQHGVVFAEVELLLKFSVTADLHGADFHGRAAVFGFDLATWALVSCAGEPKSR